MSSASFAISDTGNALQRDRSAGPGGQMRAMVWSQKFWFVSTFARQSHVCDSETGSTEYKHRILRVSNNT
jgi:hypothetical protein